MTRKNVPTLAHEITLNTLDGLSQAIDPARDFLRELLPSIFSRPIGLFSPLCVLNFAL